MMFLVAVVGWGLCFYPGGTVFLFGFATSWLGPVAILMIMASFWPRFTNKGAFWGALVGMILLTLSTVLDVLNIFDIAAYAHSSVIGLFSTLIVGVIVSLCTKPNYYGVSDWKRDPKEGKRLDVLLSDFDKKVLAMTRYGVITMAEITDYLGCDSRVSKEAVENLDKGGYIVRVSMYGSKFYHLAISEKGEQILDALSGEEEALREAGLSYEQFQVLANANVSHEQMQKYAASRGFDSLRTTAVVSLLDHRGYVKQRGLMKRQVVLTEKGKHVVEAHKDLIETIS